MVIQGVVPIGLLETELARLLEKYHAQAAYLFGSYARGEARVDSDVDILVIGGPRFLGSDVFAIAEEVYRAFGKDIDVYEISEIDPRSPFYSELMKDRVRAA